MAWNQPGGDNQNPDPWGNKKSNGPPDLDKIISQFFNKLRGTFTQKTIKNKSAWQPTPETHHSIGWSLGAIAAIVIAGWFLSGLFIVNPAEQAVMLRFGQYSDTKQPGLRWMARFIDSKYPVDVQKIYSFSLQGDYLTKSSEQSDLPNQVTTTVLSQANPSDKSKNLVSVELNVQYRITDPRAYLFNVVNPDATIQEVTSGALSDVIGQMKLDEVLTTGREYVSSGVLELTKQILGKYNTGLDVVGVTLRKVTAPDQVKVAFNDVNRADQDKATYVQQAQAYASKVVPLAQGGASKILADATAYQQQVVLNAQAHVAKFQALLSIYKSAPQVTRERLYLETMQKVFKNSSKVLVDVGSGNNVLYLPIDQLMKQNKPAEVEVKS